MLGLFGFDAVKRQADDEIEKQVSAKKQKIEEVAAKQKKEAKLQKVKKESSSDDSSSESEDEVLGMII